MADEETPDPPWKKLADALDAESVADVRVDPARFKPMWQDVETIGEESFRSVIERRLNEARPDRAFLRPGSYDIPLSMLDYIMGSIPDEMYTQQIADGIDLRPFLDAAADAATDDDDKTWFLDQLNTIESAFDERIQKSNTTVTVDTDYVPGEAWLEPGTEFDKAVAEKIDPTTASAWDDAAAEIPVPAGPADVSADLAANGAQSIMDAQTITDNYQTLQGVMEPFTVDVGDVLSDIGQFTPSPLGIDQAKPLQPREAKLYLTTLKREDVVKVQRRMAEAGFFNEYEIGPVLGEAWDDTTMAAWDKVLLTAAQQSTKERKVTPGEVLSKRGRTYRDQLRQTRLDLLAPLDRSVLNNQADSVAYELLGREFTHGEVIMLERYVDNLRSQRAGFMPGSSTNPTEGSLPNEIGYTDTDVEDYIKSNTKGEGGRNQMQRYVYGLTNGGD